MVLAKADPERIAAGRCHGQRSFRRLLAKPRVGLEVILGKVTRRSESPPPCTPLLPTTASAQALEAALTPHAIAGNTDRVQHGKATSCLSVLACERDFAGVD
mmetsp:Transcript_72571/g.212712  ORF Transcript_72571/g.212712 Transcript_72571/m.212712 type:complete len:102 (-) Transcript_72571:6-311(-)